MKYLYKIGQQQYDYIIGGAGLAGLTLAYKMYQAGLLKTQSLLIIDADLKDKNDRTWSFWAQNQKEITDFPISQSWEYGIIKTTSLEEKQLLKPYKYYSIAGLAYYNFIKEALSSSDNIDWLVSEVNTVDSEKQVVETAAGQVAYKQYFFKNYFSASHLKAKLSESSNHFIWQHFFGKEVSFEVPVFDQQAITYMDFNVEQPENGLAFIYILPSSEKTALVEYTLFSADLLDKKQYEATLDTYLAHTYQQQKYKVLDEEYNKIPMTTLLGEKSIRNCITIGTMAGTVKASTGYSFVRNQAHCTQIIKALLAGKQPQTYKPSIRHQFYDKVLIDVIKSGLESGVSVFEALYHRNSLVSLLKFLDEDTSLIEEVKIMNTVPKASFIQAVLRNLI